MICVSVLAVVSLYDEIFVFVSTVVFDVKRCNGWLNLRVKPTFQQR